MYFNAKPNHIQNQLFRNIFHNFWKSVFRMCTENVDVIVIEKTEAGTLEKKAFRDLLTDTIPS